MSVGIRYEHGAGRVKSLLTLAALMALLPITLLGVTAAWLHRRYGRASRRDVVRPDGSARRTVLISGGKMTKALVLARAFHRAGHRVVLIESDRYWMSGHRFSNAVDRFRTVPAPESAGYAAALLGVVVQERVDVYVPVCSPVSSLCDSHAMTLLSPHCEVLHAGPAAIARIDDKYRFARAAASFDLPVPETVLITDPEQLAEFDFASRKRPFILKSIRYDAVRRLDLTRLPLDSVASTVAHARSLPISVDNPWILQEFVSGTEYCTHGLFRDGALMVHCCCASSAFQVNYDSLDKPAIEDWVRRFGRGLALTGQASFDFIEADDDGRLYAIECNPRTHSAITLFEDHPALADAYLGRTPRREPIRPLPAARPTWWLAHEVWRSIERLRTGRSPRDRLRTIVSGRDAVFDGRDPLPFLMLHHWHVPLLLLRDLREGKGWLRIDFNIGKLVQAGGD